jgi:hypothetical protein
MATTTNYGFEVPDDTDLVKDGALAMRDLGQDVDTQLFTALGGDYPGLRLVKKQTIGTAVSAVTVTDAFSATYENYKIVVSGGVGSTGGATLNMTFGSTTSGYYWAGSFVVWTSGVITTITGDNVANWGRAGIANTNSINGDIDVLSPNLAKKTIFKSQYLQNVATNGNFVNTGGFVNNDLQYTAFTLTASSGTLTGGTIYVYGYGAS